MAFGIQSPREETSDKPAVKPSNKMNPWLALSLSAFGTNFMGSLALLVSALLPGTQPPVTPMQAVRIESAVTPMSQKHHDDLPNIMESPGGQSLEKSVPERESLKKVLKRIGYGLIAFSLFPLSVSNIRIGRVQGQPCFWQGALLMAGTGILGASEILSLASITGKALVPLYQGMLFTGYANIVNNHYEKNPTPSARREFDMKPLVSGQTWKHIFQERTARRDVITLLRDWKRYSEEDHALLLWTLQPKTLMPVLTDTVKQTGQGLVAVASGKRMDIAPSADRNRLGALCYYLSGGSFIAVGEALPIIGNALYVMGTVLTSLDLLAVGTQRRDWIGAGLKGGFLLRLAGYPIYHTDLGFAMANAGVAGQSLIAVDLQKERCKGEDALKTPGTD